jgi:hypothetical protein
VSFTEKDPTSRLHLPISTPTRRSDPEDASY